MPNSEGGSVAVEERLFLLLRVESQAISGGIREEPAGSAFKLNLTENLGWVVPNVFWCLCEVDESDGDEMHLSEVAPTGGDLGGAVKDGHSLEPRPIRRFEHQWFKSIAEISASPPGLARLVAGSRYGHLQ